MDFCKSCSKLVHKRINGLCVKCSKCKVKKATKPISVCMRCNKVRKTKDSFCEFCLSVLENKGVCFCKSCKTEFKGFGREECNKCYQKRYSKENRGAFRATVARRRASKIKATPSWLNPTDFIIIKHLYDSCPEGYHVDHIVPLRGKTVCGLHVPWNLRVIPAEENLSKGNRVWPNMWENLSRGWVKKHLS